MKGTILLMCFTLAVTTLSAQKSYTPDDNEFKIKKSYYPYELAQNDQYHYFIEDVAPGTQSVGAYYYLIAYNTKTGTFERNRLKLTNQKKSVVGSIASGNELILLYTAKSKETKEFGLFADRLNTAGEVLKHSTIMNLDERKDVWKVESVQSPSGDYLLVNFENNFVLLDKDLKKQYTSMQQVDEIGKMFVSNKGRAFIIANTGEKPLMLVLDEEGELEEENALQIPAGFVNGEFEMDLEDEDLYFVANIGDPGKKCFFCLEGDFTVQKTIIYKIDAEDGDVDEEGSYTYPSKLNWYHVNGIYPIGDEVYVIVQRQYIKTTEMKTMTVVNHHAEDFYVLHMDDENVIAKKFDNNTLVEVGEFTWLLRPVVKEVDGDPYLMYYERTNAALKNVHKLHVGKLGKNLAMQGKRSFTVQKETLINHTALVPTSDDRKFTGVGFLAKGFNYRLATATLVF